MSTTRILIVDDDPALLTALTGALQLRLPEVEVDTCESGVAAIDRISHYDYDAVVSDIKMPGMDGLALLKEIRTVQPDLPTLLVTGHGQHDLAVQALRGGAFDFIQKPIERDYFVASLTRAIRVRKMDRQLRLQQAELADHADHLEQTVESRTEELRELNRRKDEFLAMLSHELRNPLACILSAAELVQLNCNDASLTGECCSVIAQQAAHMSRLLDDLLDLSRINSNKIVLRKRHFRLRKMVDAAVASTQSLMRERGHALQVRSAPGVLDCYAHADPTRLEQVVVNLLNNAAKYSNPGGNVEFSIQREGTEIVMRVTDDGIGIPANELASVFEPFVQVNTHSRRSGGGLGIGLALVRQLVELHGGSVFAASAGEHMGSSFTVRLPIAIEFPQAAASPALEEKVPLTGRRVLVVEDQPRLASLTRKLLEQAGQEVVAVVLDGPSAIEAAQAHAPDLILMDIGLPGMSGYEVARQIREISELEATILVAMTGYGTHDDQIRSREAGFDYHLVKPCTFESLSECIERSRRRTSTIHS